MTRYTNNFNLPPEIVNAITNDSYDHPTDEKTIPCSKLIAPARITILSKRHAKEIVKDISSEVWALFGTAVHYILSRQTSKDVILEKRLSFPCGSYTISGKPDYFNTSTGELKDIKVTSVYKVIFGVKEGYKDWENQLNVYAWLLRKNDYVVTKLTITAILRDWNQREATNNSSYPNVQIQEIDLPLWTYDDQEKFVSDKLTSLRQNDELADDKLDLCTPEQRWASPTTWAVMKEGRKSAVRVFDMEEKAKEYVRVSYPDIEKKKDLDIQERPGEDKRCANYCDCNEFCGYYKKKEKE